MGLQKDNTIPPTFYQVKVEMVTDKLTPDGKQLTVLGQKYYQWAYSEKGGKLVSFDNQGPTCFLTILFNELDHTVDFMRKSRKEFPELVIASFCEQIGLSIIKYE